MWRTQLLQHTALHDRNARSQRHRLDLVVRHVNNGGIQALVQLFNLGTHVNAQLCVEVRQRLVEQVKLWLPCQRTTYRYPLALPSRKLARLAIQQMLYLQQLSHRLNAFAALGLVNLAHLKRELDILGHRHVWIKRVGLEDHRNVAICRSHARDVAALQPHHATGRLIEPRDNVHQRTFAATRGAYKHQKFAVLQRD